MSALRIQSSISWHTLAKAPSSYSEFYSPHPHQTWVACHYQAFTLLFQFLGFVLHFIFANTLCLSLLGFRWLVKTACKFTIVNWETAYENNHIITAVTVKYGFPLHFLFCQIESKGIFKLPVDAPILSPLEGFEQETHRSLKLLQFYNTFYNTICSSGTKCYINILRFRYKHLSIICKNN